MKILVIDYPNQKISRDHIMWWEMQGHTVWKDMYWDIEKAKQCDVAICFWAEGQAAEMLTAKKNGEITCKTIVQLVDIDAYQGPWRGFGDLFKYADEIVFMAQHIKDYCVPANSELARGVVIPLPIDTHHFVFKERQDGLNIAFIAHLWSSKGIPLLYQLFAKLRQVTGRDYQLHILGTRNSENWLHKYLEHIAGELGIAPHIHYQAQVPDVNEWLEDKNYLISTSYKDAFSLVVGEAMARGIKTLLHNWWGSKAIWPEEYIWTTLDECIEKFINQPYESNKYRTFIEEHYSLAKVMPLWDSLLHTNGK